MARLRGHTTLDFAQPLHVLRASMTVAGQTLAQGDVLPWRELGLDQRKVHQLWTGRHIGHQAVGSRDGAEDTTALVSPAPPLPLAAPAVSPPVTVQRAEEPASSRRRR
jgi:hypothetical protein